MTTLVDAAGNVQISLAWFDIRPQWKMKKAVLEYARLPEEKGDWEASSHVLFETDHWEADLPSTSD